MSLDGSHARVHKGPLATCKSCASERKGVHKCRRCKATFVLSTANHETEFCSLACENKFEHGDSPKGNRAQRARRGNNPSPLKRESRIPQTS